jgi:TonB family protein
MRVIPAAMTAAILLLACGSQPKTASTADAVLPRVDSLVTPVYPESARKAGIEGTAVVDVTISTDGTVLGCSLATSSGNDLLDAAAVGAAQTSKYAPGTKNGKPVVMTIKVPFRFRLADSDLEKHSGARNVGSGATWYEQWTPAMEA